MANSKISALTSATTPLAGTETLPIVQSSTTKQVSVANLTAGRAVAAGTLVVGSTAKQANNSFEVNVNTSYAGFIQNTGSGTGGTPINPSTNYGLHIGWNRSNGNAESNLVWGSGVGALSDLIIAQWTGTTYSVHTTFKKGGELNVATSNVEIGTSGKGVTTSGAIPLGLGTNGSTSQATLDTSGNLKVTGRTYTNSGSNTIANGATQTLFTLGTGDVYIVNCSFQNFSGGTTTAIVWLPQSGNTSYSGSAILGQNFATFSISVSGANVQISNSVGGSVTYYWSAVKLY
jgi:hypothetical protein